MKNPLPEFFCRLGRTMMFLRKWFFKRKSVSDLHRRAQWHFSQGRIQLAQQYHAVAADLLYDEHGPQSK